MGVLPVPKDYMHTAIMKYDLYPAGFTPRVTNYYIDSKYYNPQKMCFWRIADYKDPNTGVVYGYSPAFLYYDNGWKDLPPKSLFYTDRLTEPAPDSDARDGYGQWHNQDYIPSLFVSSSLYVFDTYAHAERYVANKDLTDEELRKWTLNYEDVQQSLYPLNTTFSVYRNNIYKPKTTIRWKSPYIGEGKTYDANDVTVTIKCWESTNFTEFPIQGQPEPNPLPSNTKTLFSGRFSTGKFQVTWDKLQNIFRKIKIGNYGFVFDMYVKADDGREGRHCWAYMFNNNAIQYNKVALKNWKAGYFIDITNDISIAVIAEGDGESDEGYEVFGDSIEKTAEVSPYSAVGALTQSYALTTSRCKAFGDYLWNAGVFSNIKLMNNSPIENVIACKIFPMSFTGTDEKMKLGNVEMPTMGLKMSSNSTFLFDIGTITLKGHYESFLDYEPFTSVNIFLPFIGFQTLPCTLLMNHSVNVKYAVDVITGSCKALIFRDGLEVLSFSGVMGIDIPVSAQNRAQVEMAYIETGAKTTIDTVATVATGGASKAMTALSAVGGASEGLLDLAKAQYRTTTSGSHNSATSACETLQCYIIVDRPIWQNVQGFNHAYGRMCNLTQNLSNLRGFTICNSHIDLSGIECTEEEREEIFNYLTGGVIL